jgi:hypothetical protein
VPNPHRRARRWLDPVAALLAMYAECWCDHIGKYDDLGIAGR